MKFRIVGADRETGEDVEIVVDARDEVAAETIANRRNIMVSSVVLVRSLPAETQQSPPKHIGDMTHDEARNYYEDQRQDPAALDRRTNGPRRPRLVQSMDPVCPACGGSLGNRKVPSRRSSFKCKKCGAQLYADAKQHLFESAYLTEKQKDLVEFLWQLDHWVWTAGTIHDFYWAKSQIGKDDKPISDDAVSDTIWFLLNYNRKNLSKINPDADAFMIKTYREELTELIQVFREAQEDWRKSRST